MPGTAMTSALLEAPATPADDVTRHRKMWIAALRSGEYKQTKGSLRDRDGYCCLGVACDTAMKAGLPLSCEPTDDYKSSFKFRDPTDPDDDHWWMGSLPPSVAEWLGLEPSQENITWDPDRDSFGIVREPDNAICANDSDEWEWGFSRIADKLEQHWGLK